MATGLLTQAMEFVHPRAIHVTPCEYPSTASCSPIDLRSAVAMRSAGSRLLLYSQLRNPAQQTTICCTRCVYRIQMCAFDCPRTPPSATVELPAGKSVSRTTERTQSVASAAIVLGANTAENCVGGRATRTNGTCRHLNKCTASQPVEAHTTATHEQVTCC